MRRNLNVNEIASLGSNVKPVIQNENCSILMLNDMTGEGVMTIYRVLPGAMICFSDMHMEQCGNDPVRAGGIVEEIHADFLAGQAGDQVRMDNEIGRAHV